MSSAITTAGQARISELMGTEQALVIDRMVLALIPDLDASQAVDRDQQLPDPAYIVHTADIADENKGYVGPDKVVYSIVLGSDLGDFSFNWIGTLEKDTDTVITVTTTPETPKRKTDLANNTTGNCITRNIILAFQNAQAVTGITVTAQTWQFDYEATLAQHLAGTIDPSQTGSENRHITNDQAKTWNDSIISNTARFDAFEDNFALSSEFGDNRIQAELFTTGYTIYDETETTWTINLTDGSALAVDGGAYEVHGLTVDDLHEDKAAVIRRTDNDAVLNAFYRDTTHTVWTPVPWAWKRDAGNGFIDVEYQVPARGIFDMRFESTAGASAVDPTIDYIVFIECYSGLGGDHRPPNTPSIVTPIDGATDIDEQPSITTSAYSSPVGTSIQGTEIQISTQADFATGTITDSSGTVNGISYAPAKGVLSISTLYYARARHIDQFGSASGWSDVISFTTAVSFVSVVKPTCINPESGDEMASPNGVTLISSDFTVEGGTDTHAGSQWQISTDPSFLSVLHDSGTDTENLTSYIIPDDILERGVQYYWRVRHQGATEGWSDYSNATVFSVSTYYKALYVATTGGTGTLVKVDAETLEPIQNMNGNGTTWADIGFTDGPMATDVNCGLVYGDNNKLYIAGIGGAKIARFDENCNFEQIGDLEPSTGLTLISSLTFGGGYLWAIKNGTLVKVDPDTLLAVAEYAVASDGGAGIVYMADEDNLVIGGKNTSATDDMSVFDPVADATVGNILTYASSVGRPFYSANLGRVFFIIQYNGEAFGQIAIDPETGGLDTGDKYINGLPTQYVYGGIHWSEKKQIGYVISYYGEFWVIDENATNITNVDPTDMDTGTKAASIDLDGYIFFAGRLTTSEDGAMKDIFAYNGTTRLATTATGWLDGWSQSDTIQNGGMTVNVSMTQRQSVALGG